MNKFYKSGKEESRNHGTWRKEIIPISREGRYELDLDEPQIFDPPLKCWVADAYTSQWVKQKLVAIVELDEGIRYLVADRSSVISYEFCTLINPEKPRMRFMTGKEIMGFLLHSDKKILIKLLDGLTASDWKLPGYWNYVDLRKYIYAEFDSSGKQITEEKQFMIEV